jgi:hypothetical protein
VLLVGHEIDAVAVVPPLDPPLRQAEQGQIRLPAVWVAARRPAA